MARRDPAAQPGEQCQENPQAPDQPVTPEGQADGASAAEPLWSRKSAPASRFQHHHPPPARRCLGGARLAPQSGTRPWQSGRERGRFARHQREYTLGLGRTISCRCPFSTMDQAFLSKCLIASGLYRRGRAPGSRAAGWDLACSSPRRCSSAPAQPSSFGNSNKPGEGAMVRVRWPRSDFVYAEESTTLPLQRDPEGRIFPGRFCMKTGQEIANHAFGRE